MLGAYAQEIEEVNLDNIPENAKIAVPNDAYFLMSSDFRISTSFLMESLSLFASLRGCCILKQFTLLTESGYITD